jgi:hypothetical protein
MPISLKRYDFNARHAGRIVSDRECAIQEVARVLPTHRTMALDSAANVFREALNELGVPHLELDDEALPAVFRVASRVGTVTEAGMISPPMALDSAAAKSFSERHPEAARIGFA